MSENIGTKIEQLRKDLNLTIEELAQAAGILVSQMALIERGEVTPSIATLIKLSRYMGVRLGTILDGTETPGPAISTDQQNTITINRANTNGSAHENLNFVSLAQQKVDRNMEPYIIDVKYSVPDQDIKSHHEGEEFLYIIEGEAELRYGTQTYTLTKGDSIYYDSVVPHCLSTTVEGQTAKVLAVTYTPY